MDEFQRTIRQAVKKLAEARRQIEAVRSPLDKPPEDPPPGIAMALGRRRAGGEFSAIAHRLASRGRR
jgi:hypothetical protein